MTKVSDIYDTLTSTHLNYHQKLNQLCIHAENMLDVLEIPAGGADVTVKASFDGADGLAVVALAVRGRWA